MLSPALGLAIYFKTIWYRCTAAMTVLSRSPGLPLWSLAILSASGSMGLACAKTIAPCGGTGIGVTEPVTPAGHED